LRVTSRGGNGMDESPRLRQLTKLERRGSSRTRRGSRSNGRSPSNPVSKRM
jgi:hypothetical protein